MMRHVMHVGFNDSYLRSLDFDDARVSLLTHRAQAESLPPEIAGLFARIAPFEAPGGIDIECYDKVVDDIVAAADEVVGELGAPDAVIGLFEHTVLPAAALRDRFDSPGMSHANATLSRDKVAMKQAVAAAGVRVPKFDTVTPDMPVSQVKETAAGYPGRIVLKPRLQAASIGIHMFDDAEGFMRFVESEGVSEGYEIEEFVEGTVCHFDGVVRGGDILFFCPSRYIGTCFDFESNKGPLASVTFDDPALVDGARAMTDSVLGALDLRDSVFHLEAFLTPEGELVFLEISARHGGGPIRGAIQAAYGVDLVRESYLAGAGEPSQLERRGTILQLAESGGPAASGWLLPPMVEKSRCVVRGIRGLDDPPASIIQSELPTIGQTLNEHAGIYVGSGTFVLAGASGAQIESDIAAILDSYAIRVETLDDPEDPA